MGNIDSVSQQSSIQKISRSSFEFLKIIGRGGFGRVWKVLHKPTKKIYAMKSMLKTRIIDTKNEQNVIDEREILSKLNHPFIANMHYAFQDYSNLYLVQDYLSGGNLRYQMIKRKKFTENQIKFLLGCLILSLSYLKTKGIIHRDIKPENLVFDSEGYLRLTDFGLSKLKSEVNCNETSGTPGYMSPETINGFAYSFTADYYSIGVIGYELMTGKRPHAFSSKEDLRNSIKSVKRCHGSNCSEEFINFIYQLLINYPQKRLGYNGIEEIQNHEWFNGFDWEQLKEKEIRSDFEGMNIENELNDKMFKVEYGAETLQRFKKYTNNQKYNFAFFGYTFVNIKHIETSPSKKVKCLKLKENNSDLLRVISKASLNADLVPSIDSDNQLPFIPSHHKETHRIIKLKKMKLNNIDFCNSKLNRCIQKNTKFEKVIVN